MHVCIYLVSAVCMETTCTFECFRALLVPGSAVCIEPKALGTYYLEPLPLPFTHLPILSTPPFIIIDPFYPLSSKALLHRLTLVLSAKHTFEEPATSVHLLWRVVFLLVWTPLASRPRQNPAV